MHRQEGVGRDSHMSLVHCRQTKQTMKQQLCECSLSDTAPVRIRSRSVISLDVLVGSRMMIAGVGIRPC